MYYCNSGRHKWRIKEDAEVCCKDIKEYKTNRKRVLPKKKTNYKKKVDNLIMTK